MEMQITVKQANKIWESPDGQRTIWELVMDRDGQLVKAKTFSQVISIVGWSGTVLLEQRPNKRGENEAFVKQVPKEGGFGGRQPKDEAAIRAMWAIDKSIRWLNGTESSLGTVETTARELFHMVDRVKVSAIPGSTAPEPDTLYDADGPVDFSKVKEVMFG